jgi:hypothetical protein
LRPARALLELALKNLHAHPVPAPPPDLTPLPLHARSLCTVWIQKLDTTQRNPWSPQSAPRLDPSFPCLIPSTPMS